MRSSHPAIKDARRALEQELDALKSRIRIRRDSKMKRQVLEPAPDQSKGTKLKSVSEGSGGNARQKQSHKRRELPERSFQNGPTPDSPESKRRRSRDYDSSGIIGKAGRVFRWFKGLFGR